MSQKPKRILVANFDCEDSFEKGSPTLSRKAQEKMAELAPEIRILGDVGDDIVLRPEDCDPAQYPSGHTRVLAWGETLGVHRLRHQLSEPKRGAPPGGLPDLPLHELLWRLPLPSPEAAARANHRTFQLAAATELDLRLPGAAMIESLEELTRGTATTTHGTESWVLKTPYGAAGRGRVFLDRGWKSNQQLARRIGGLLRRHGSLLLEPWMNRVADFGCCSVVVEGDLRIVGLHRQTVTARGTFRGVELGERALAAPDLQPEECASLIATASNVADRLLAVGYRGPFGLDAWRYIDHEQKIRFHPLGEINARLTFGFLAHAAREPSASVTRVRHTSGR